MRLRKGKAEEPGTTVEVSLWRHADPLTHALPGVALGTVRAGADAVGEARECYERGARLAVLDQPVDLRRPQARSVTALTLVRELTAQGIVVSWSLAADAALDVLGALGHLYPPVAILGHPGHEALLDTWRRRFYIGKCVYRQGPGFLQVRDRRSGILQRFTIDESRYMDTVERLVPAPGDDPADLPLDVVRALEGETLVVRFGQYLWWAPYRVRRWPQPSMTV